MPQLTEEELKKMTPDQLAELQKQNCIFCHIISGKVASKKIYEDDKCIGILDINPANPGHVLLMPKEHYAIMPLMPDETIGHLFMVAKGISHACLRAFKAEGTNIFVANGTAAGQKAQHFMLHVIPRKDKDGLAALDIPKRRVGDEQLDELKKALQARINYVFGVKEEAPIMLDRKAEPLEGASDGGKADDKEEPGKEEPAKKYAKKDEKKKGMKESDKGYHDEPKDDKDEGDEDDDKGDDEGVDLDSIAKLLGGSIGR